MKYTTHREDDAKWSLPDSAIVVRGGSNTMERFVKGRGVKQNCDGTIEGVSVNSAKAKTVNELAKTIPNAQIGVTTVGRIRDAGGNVTPKPTANNPYHCEMYGITPKKAEELFTPTQPNQRP